MESTFSTVRASYSVQAAAPTLPDRPRRAGGSLGGVVELFLQSSGSGAKCADLDVSDAACGRRDAPVFEHDMRIQSAKSPMRNGDRALENNFEKGADLYWGGCKSKPVP
ncbi:hypothetical protein [Streptomyces sp. NBC_01446]|uniref:hypothetical protein n=1 Tax=Streptomyces sp. NBC_01446 TaxID=2903870 RepID=UPI0022596573|nr:hypothetical protein [Streptomyces sp. NBC_01446]MCX4641496.1 hypothetical protein [Streptomyces sp. NBC_01446]